MIVSIKYKCLSRQVVLLIQIVGSESARFNHKNHNLQIFSIFRFGKLTNITIILKKLNMIIMRPPVEKKGVCLKDMC